MVCGRTLSNLLGVMVLFTEGFEVAIVMHVEIEAMHESDRVPDLKIDYE
jgi:hypothetical protein